MTAAQRNFYYGFSGSPNAEKASPASLPAVSRRRGRGPLTTRPHRSVMYGTPHGLYGSQGGLRSGSQGGLRGAAGDIGKQMVISAPSIAGTAASTSETAAASAGGTWLGMAPALAVPVIGAAVMGVTIALTMLFNRKRPKQKVATTDIVDTAEPILRDNLDAYMSGPHTVSSQAQALANFDANWEWVLQNCGAPEMGDPGQWCINDRSPGGKWDWFAYYRDPISQDPNVVPDPAVLDLTEGPGGAFGFGETGQELTRLAQAKVGGIPAWVLAAAAVGALLVSGDGGGK